MTERGHVYKYEYMGALENKLKVNQILVLKSWKILMQTSFINK